jgi:hypothetical protein
MSVSARPALSNEFAIHLRPYVSLLVYAYPCPCRRGSRDSIKSNAGCFDVAGSHEPAAAKDERDLEILQ